jgi:uncharacterized protein (DUF885 family)
VVTGVRRILALAAVLAVSCGRPRNNFGDFAEEYFNAYYAAHPSQGTAAGFHQYDAVLEDLSAGARAARIGTLKRQRERIKTIRTERLEGGDAIDAAVLEGQIEAELLQLETLKTWRANPMIYVELPGSAIDGLMKRDFAPAAARLKSVSARLKSVPAVFQAMRENVGNPPKEFTDLAIRMAAGSVGFFRDSVASWAKQAAGADRALLDEFEAANRAAVEAAASAAAWLKSDLAPRSKGNYAIGAENFARQLLYEEMMEVPLARLLEIGEANLEKDYRAFVETARAIDPRRTPAEVMASLAADHPSAEGLMEAAKGNLEAIRRFLIEKNLVTVPSEVRPIVQETPPYARSGSFASMDSPGAYETKAEEAFYYVTPVEAEWDAKHKEEHLRLYNRPVMDMISIHEAYPGHFVQFLYVKQFPSKTRKLTYSSSNVEGWAHYSEQMMVEEGFGAGDLKVRLAQLQEALLRDCRYVAGIRLHTRGMSVEDAAKIFVTKGFQEPANAYEEARRGAYNPTYLYYTAGKLQIYKLREDYRKARGAAFSLREFHDAFLRQGGIPIKLMREILLPGDTAPVL